MSSIIVSFLNGVAFAVYCYIIALIILRKNETNVKKIALAFLYFFIVYYAILLIFDSLHAIFFAGICAFIFIRVIFKETIFMSLFISIIIHTGKILFKILILLFLNKEKFQLINTTYTTLNLSEFYINISSVVLSIILISLLRKPLRKITKYISSLKHREIILLIIIYVEFIVIIILQAPYETITLNALTDIFVIFTITGIGVFNSSSEMKMEDLNKYYQDIFEYSKANEDLLNNYKMQVHENKNKILMIKGMLDGPKKETKKYVDSILREINEDKSNTNYWLTELKYVPLPGVRNFINYKLIELKKLGAQIEVFVSSELEMIDEPSLGNNEYNQLSTILGVILDNMIDAIKELDEKLISINIYLEDNKIQAEFVNNFAGEIDLNRLNEVGYTTKGEQHGVGLPLVAKITKMNKRFECKPKIIDNFFVQHLKIKLYNKSNLQKIPKN